MGELFSAKKVPPHPFKKALTKKYQKKIPKKRIDGRREVKPRFGCRNFVGATETLQNKRVVLHQSGSPKGLPYRLFFYAAKIYN